MGICFQSPKVNIYTGFDFSPESPEMEIGSFRLFFLVKWDLPGSKLTGKFYLSMSISFFFIK